MFGQTSAMFDDRRAAGRALGKALDERLDASCLVLGLPRGGVPVALEVARALDAPMDLLVVRKLGVPGHRELAMGAIASGGIRVLNRDVVDGLRLSSEVVDRVAEAEAEELVRRERAYRGEVPRPDLTDRTAVVVDDGLATGATMRAAVSALKEMDDGAPSRVIVAAPVGAAQACSALGTLADDVLCLRTPEPFLGVGRWYRDFAQVSDDEVRTLLDEARRDLPPIPTADR